MYQTDSHHIEDILKLIRNKIQEFHQASRRLCLPQVKKLVLTINTHLQGRFSVFYNKINRTINILITICCCNLWQYMGKKILIVILHQAWCVHNRTNLQNITYTHMNTCCCCLLMTPHHHLVNRKLCLQSEPRMVAGMSHISPQVIVISRVGGMYWIY